MFRSYKYRLYPTKIQAAALATWLDLTRELYNAALQERRDAWQKRGKSVTKFDQYSVLPEVREVRPEFNAVPIAVLRGTIGRLDRAFAGFFQRCKEGKTPGYPRFKAHDRYLSLLLDDLGTTSPLRGKKVAIPLLGKVKLKMNRQVEGIPKAMRILRDTAGRWFVTFACIDVSEKPLPPCEDEIGIDLGINTFAALSDGSLVPNPRVGEAARTSLERAQRRVSKRKKGSHRRRKAVVLLGKAHLHVQNIRRQFHIDTARKLVTRYGYIYAEDLNVKGLAGGMLARSVHDAGWSSFLGWLACKAEEAGRVMILVNPFGTSQVCSACGEEVRKGLSVRVHDCPYCGYKADRDVNAALNVLRLGKSLRRGAPAVRGRQRPEKSRPDTGFVATPVSN
ncbi:MAG: transposase [bacterium]|nr:transposase [bacterium]